MTKLYCFSGSGHSLAVADALSAMLGCGVTPIVPKIKMPWEEETAVIVFPVYCQNIPGPVKGFLHDLPAKHVVLIATYGKISYGNVLHEAQKLVRGQVIAGAYIPMGHTFLDGDRKFDPDFLLPIAERIQKPREVLLPKTKKNLWSDIFPGFRSRVSVKLTKNDRCNSCGLCEERCPTKAIKAGKITAACIRCLRCVANCPQKALEYENRRILDRYLKRHYSPEYRLYL